MGQDYNARKSAKKGRKRIARDGAPNDAEGGKRIRKKNGPRRLCRCGDGLRSVARADAHAHAALCPLTRASVARLVKNCI
jgi:hypothetical protein